VLDGVGYGYTIEDLNKTSVDFCGIQITHEQKMYLARFGKTNVSNTWNIYNNKNAIKEIARIAFTYDGFKGSLEAFVYIIDS